MPNCIDMKIVKEKKEDLKGIDRNVHEKSIEFTQ